MSTEEIADRIKQSVGPTPYIIALSGFGGAGKSTCAKKLIALLGEALIVPLDEFILGRLQSSSKEWSDDYDWQRIIDQVLEPIKRGVKSIEWDVYDWKEDKVINKKAFEVPKYVIVEGVGLIREGLRAYFDASIWIDVPLERAVSQGKKRDHEEYRVDHDALWEDIWSKKDQNYFEEYRPDQIATFVLDI